ncbi:hypothetical protein [Methylobacterium aquaticum]|uniref:hypothetical protein n=1 Tax=Methylobacterium aquaticum TaxID=270351 RepID=UPI00193119E2|nr:hypothetical protein [Methylobacterium aquaticum]QRE74383.1 hypothetical protein F1D61_12900 [Methylobacterium aquaticum]
MDVRKYTVTDLAGPYVAGRQASPGDEIELTEPQARAELLSGAIAEKGKEAKAEAALAGSRKLPDTQARARGADSAKSEAKSETKAEAKAETGTEPSPDPAASAAG